MSSSASRHIDGPWQRKETSLSQVSQDLLESNRLVATPRVGLNLGAAVFTEDIERGEEIATKRLHAGACFVNSFVKSDPRLPFGGIKESGYGRELADFGIREFVNIKTVYVK